MLDRFPQRTTPPYRTIWRHRHMSAISVYRMNPAARELPVIIDVSRQLGLRRSAEREQIVFSLMSVKYHPDVSPHLHWRTYV